MKREATISADGLYRFDLTRTVQAGCSCARCSEYRAQPVASLRAGYVLFVLCNPSTADAETDDATERRGWGFANSWGFGKFVFVNTNPHRSTDPKKVRPPDIQALVTNETWIGHHARYASLTVCAWGTNADATLVARTVGILRANARALHVLELTKIGVPKHPLYLKKGIVPQLWTPTTAQPSSYAR